ncbi:MAG TPA: hypothetical protein VET30_11265 [Pseudoxanthomonas sp.]|nr:hypothetical protein [Pseudoxanthomonas sp.]
MQETTRNTRPARWMAPALLLLGGACIATLWILLALYLQRSCGWMAVCAALACALMLRLGGMPRGVPRALLAVLATLAIVVLVNWMVTAAQIGFAMGLNPWDSALKLGVDYAWTLAGLAHQTADLVFIAVSLVTAAIAAR